MILVDSSVWIYYFRGTITPQTDKLDSLLASEPLTVGDVILAEVLQGFTEDRHFTTAKQLLTSLTLVDLAGRDIALRAAMNYRQLRQMGITVRKTIDSIIAAWCIQTGADLLHADRDFDIFVEHLGLRSVL